MLVYGDAVVLPVPVDYLLQTKVLANGALAEGVDLTFLAFILFIAVIAGMVQLVEMRRCWERRYIL